MEQDQISDLPRIILHDILSRLPEKDAARTSVLSKVWAETWSTFPILSFRVSKTVGAFTHSTEVDFPDEKEDFFRKRKCFVDYVNKTLLRFHDQGLAIKKIDLSVHCFDLHYMSRDVDLWFKLAAECRVEVLKLVVPGSGVEGRGCCYDLPTGILEAKSLNKLVLKGGIYVDKAFMDCSIKFFSLRELNLSRVLVGDEQAIEHLISRCPLIESVILNWCFVSNLGSASGLPEPRTRQMKSLTMRGLPNLKEVDIEGIEEVYIDAPSLESLSYCPGDAQKLDFARCTNLKELCLWNFKSTIVTEWFIELFHNFPLLESLELDNCTMSERVYISSDKLKALLLSDCSNLMEIIIDAPNLSSCQCRSDGAAKPIISFLRSSSQLEVKVHMFLDHRDLGDLREFIQNLKPHNVSASLSLFIHQPNADALNPIVLQNSSSLPIIKHLELRSVPKNETLFWPVVNGLLSSCCPETISLSLQSRLGGSCNRAFIEFFYETLMGRKENDCFCSSGHAKCWWHDLKGVKVTSTRKTDQNADLKTMLDALPTELPAWGTPREKIIFMLEW